MARKHKLTIRDRKEFREFSHKVEVEKPDDEALANAMEGAGWSDDPGTGRSVQLEDGRELLNPLPVAPPASIAARASEPSVNDLVERALARHFQQLKEYDEIDSLEDHDDFPEDEDFTPISQFEILRDEAPAIPKAAPVDPQVVSEIVQVEASARKAAPGKAAPGKAAPGKKAPAEPEPVDES